MKPKSIAVIGAGSWGTALAKLLADKGEQVFLWGRNADQMESLCRYRENRRYLPGAVLPDTLKLIHDLDQICTCSCVIMAVPSHGFREVFVQVLPKLHEHSLVISAVKGIEVNSKQTMCQVMAEEVARQQQAFALGVLSGPSFADEVALGKPTAVTVGCADLAAAQQIQKLLSTSFFRVYTSTDVLGLEISGAMKNVIALAAGIADGLGCGLNARAALITRGLAEISRLGVHLGAHPLTFSGLGGLGDLILTCTGSLSRNRSVGLKLGEGRTLKQVLAEMTMVAEGVKTTKSCWQLAQEMEVDMPILEQVYHILYQDKPCQAAVQDLFQRSLKEEIEG
jgi:glycerol-3-phosphate dehydrogenase (NAD(P)+)